jgi:hypothetical protein
MTEIPADLRAAFDAYEAAILGDLGHASSLSADAGAQLRQNPARGRRNPGLSPEQPELCPPTCGRRSMPTRPPSSRTTSMRWMPRSRPAPTRCAATVRACSSAEARDRYEQRDVVCQWAVLDALDRARRNSAAQAPTGAGSSRPPTSRRARRPSTGRSGGRSATRCSRASGRSQTCVCSPVPPPRKRETDTSSATSSASGRYRAGPRPVGLAVGRRPAVPGRVGRSAGRSHRRRQGPLRQATLRRGAGRPPPEPSSFRHAPSRGRWGCPRRCGSP